jgi:Ca-activated chloride channel family protein
MLTVTVRVRSGEYATGLNREAFQILDEKEVRPIEFFEGGEDSCSVAILIDTSASMQLFESKDVARPAAIGEALSEMLAAGDSRNEYLLAAFDRNVRFLTDWKSGQALLAEKTPIGQEGKNTAMYDACFAAIEKLGTGHHARKVLILISDGEDNLSRHTFKELREWLKRSDVTLYAVGIITGSDVGSALGMEGQGILAELSGVTGGQALFPRDKKELRQVMNLVVTQLRHQYRLGFQPNKADGPNKWHRITVRIALPSNAPPEFRKLNIQTRQGYYTH